MSSSQFTNVTDLTQKRVSQGQQLQSGLLQQGFQTGGFQTGVTNVQTSTSQETVVRSEGQTIVSHEQHIASEVPVTQQRIVTQEFVPVIHEKIITTVPIVTEEKVTTGHTIAAGKQTSQMGQTYLQGTRAEVELEAHMITGIPEQQYQQTMITQVPVTTAHLERDVIPVEVERVKYETQNVPVEVTTTTTQQGLLAQQGGFQQGFASQQGFGQQGFQQGFASQPGFTSQQFSGQQGFASQPGFIGQPLSSNVQQKASGIGASLGAEAHAGSHQIGSNVAGGLGKSTERRF